jgi:glycogenin glucosyltransferase
VEIIGGNYWWKLVMLTNRYHHNRWSLEQNLVISDPERPSRRSYLINMFIFGAISLLVGGMIYFVVDRHFLVHSSEFETLLDASDVAIIVNDHREHEAHGVLLPVDAPKDLLRTEKSNYAYVTLLCDNSGLANARVLAYGLKRAKAQFPLIIMTLPFATEGLEDLVSLGATIEKISMVPTPFKRSNGKRPSFQRLCKYSKIHAWSLTKYSKLVFLDPSLLVVQNFDEVFQYPEFSAVKVVGDEFNTGMFVLEPSTTTHQEMLNVYKLAPPNYFGEQGFLNWFFQNRTANVISTRYNTVLRQKVLFIRIYY